MLHGCPEAPTGAPFVPGKDMYREALIEWLDDGNRGAAANHFECFALIAVTEEEPQRAAILLGAAETLREKAQSPMIDSERIEYDRCVAQLTGTWQGVRIIRRRDAYRQLAELKRLAGKDILITGSRTLWNDLLAHDDGR